MAPKESSAEMLSAYLDQELEEGEREEIESFLRDSPEAQEELDDLRRVVSLVAGLPSVEAPDDFYEKLSKRLRRKQLLQPDGPLLTLISLPFQVLSILVILAVAALYMMAQLEQTPKTIERDAAVASPQDGSQDDPAPSP
jgi:anti-sigma factor RsiW